MSKKLEQHQKDSRKLVKMAKLTYQEFTDDYANIQLLDKWIYPNGRWAMDYVWFTANSTKKAILELQISLVCLLASLLAKENNKP